MRSHHIATIALAMVLSAQVAAAGKTEPLPRGSVFERRLDLAGGQLASLEMQVTIPRRELVFHRREEGYESSVRITCKARERGGLDHSLLELARVQVPDFRATRDEQAVFTRDFSLTLEPGRWEVEVLVYGRGTEIPWRRSFVMDVPDPEGPGSLLLQGPWWRRQDSRVALTPPFHFQDPWESPSDFTCFADGLSPRLTILAELTTGTDDGQPIVATLTIEDRQGETWHYARQEVSAGSRQSEIAWTLPLDRFRAGAYRVDIGCFRGESGTRVTGRLDIGLTSAAFDRDWPATLDLIAPLASAGEIETLSALPPQDRISAWDSFWAARDSLLGSAADNRRETYFQRISKANRDFSTRFLDGFRSDRGRVYLRLGPPDSIQRSENSHQFQYFEYWLYQARGEVYVFIDRHGYGEFLLLRVESR